MEFKISNLMLFLIIAVGIVALFFLILRYLSAITEKGEQKLFRELAYQCGFNFLEEDTLGLKKKIEGLLDFGLSKGPIQRIVWGKENGENIYFFTCDDEPIPSGQRGFLTPTWSVCLIECVNPFDLGIMIFHKKVWFGKVKKYKIFSQDWQEIKTSNPDLEKNIIMSTDPIRCAELMDKGLINIFLNCAETFKAKLIPRCLSLQVRKNLLAVYADQFNFNTADEFIRSYDCAKKMLEIIQFYS